MSILSNGSIPKSGSAFRLARPRAWEGAGALQGGCPGQAGGDRAWWRDDRVERAVTADPVKSWGHWVGLGPAASVFVLVQAAGRAARALRRMRRLAGCLLRP